MISLKNLREMGKNNEEVNGENALDYVESFDNLKDDNDYWTMVLLCLI